MTQNYYLEYRFIPGLLHEVKLGRNPLQSLIDIRWFKEILTNNNIDIDWDGFSIDVYDEAYSKTTLDKGKYIAYTFPPIVSVPEAKFGVIDIKKEEYYTFESDSTGEWAVGNQDMERHALLHWSKNDLSLEEFIHDISSPHPPRECIKEKGGCRKTLIVLLTLIIIIIIALIKCCQIF